MVGPCSSCGPFNQYCGHTSAAGNYYWQPMQPQQQYIPNNYNSSPYDDDENDYMYSSSSSSSYSSVDCTLSLGTPSTRSTNDITNTTKPTPHRNSVSSFCWDLLHSKQSSSSTPKPSRNTSHAATASGGADPLFVRRCANCDTTSTPLWRNGPRGPKSLCNACGIRFKKEERRAAAATTTAAAANNGQAAGMMDPHHGYYNGSWAHQYGQGTPQKMQCFGAPNEFRFIEDDRGSDTGIQFLSWLTHDRPSGLVHDFTR
ncbi:GATA transcription factor 18 [Bienertia sinuspersici]